MIKADPERNLDVLVAEKVMGWKNISPHYSKTPWGTDPKHGMNWCQLPSYSTYIVAAWEVVEKMASLDWDVNISLSSKLPSDDVERWYCEMTCGDDNAAWRDDFRFIQIWASTAPLAICLAALKAVGVEV